MIELNDFTCELFNIITIETNQYSHIMYSQCASTYTCYYLHYIKSL